jgi:hypothetical protein
MKISLNIGQDSNLSGAGAQDRVLEREILGSKRGDWTAKQSLTKTFLPLIISLANKRSEDRAKINEYVEAGKTAVIKASKKHKASDGPHKFRILAADFIETALDSVDKGSFLSRLFGK